VHVESFGSAWFQSALTTTKSTTFSIRPGVADPLIPMGDRIAQSLAGLGTRNGDPDEIAAN